MKRFLLLTLLILLGLSGFAQLDSTKTDSTRIFSTQADEYKKYVPNYSPLPPNTASIQKFGDYAVNLATGVPDISIPLYTVQDGSLSLPIVLRYHASGHRIDELASWVGWGFNLDVGGAVNRSINALADDKPVSGSYLNNPITSRDLCNSATDYTFLSSVESGSADTQPDLFTYSAPNASGKFMLRHGQTPFLIPWQPHLLSYGTASNGTINSFDIVNESGQLYHFGKYANGNLVNELQSIPSNFGWEGSGIVSWPLTQILSPTTDDKIEISYQDGGIISQSSLSYTATVNYNAGGFPISYGTAPTPSTQNRQNTQQNIHKITFSNGEVEFVQSAANRSDFADGHSLESIKVYNYENGVKQLIKLFTFHYSYFTDRLGANGRLRLDSLRVSDALSLDIQTYKIDYTTSNYSWLYKEGSSFDMTDMAKVDYYGYYNGQNNAHTLDNSYNGVTWAGGNANRSSNETYMKQAVLNKITYPSGGYSVFDFEANKIIKNSTVLTAGGLRIKSIKNYLANGNLSFMKRYELSSEDGIGIGKLTTGNWGFPATGLVGTIRYLSGTEVLKTDIISPDANIQGNPFDSSPVYYTSVKVFEEENADPIKNGRTEHTFGFEPDIIVSDPTTIQRDIKPWRRGQELSQRIYDAANALKFSKSTTYQEYKNESIQNFQTVFKVNEATANCSSCSSGMPYGFLTPGSRISANQNTLSCPNPRLVYNSGSNKTGALRPTQITEIRDGVTSNTSIHYNQNLLPDTTTTENSIAGHFYQDISIFPSHSSYDADAIALEMRARNLLSTPLESKTRENLGTGFQTISQQKTVFNGFTGNNARGLTNNILPSEIWVAPNGGTLEKRVEFKNYDADGNLLDYEVDGQPTALVWSYGNSLVSGIVKNANLAQVNAALSSSGLSPTAFSVSSLSVGQENILQNFQNAIPNTLIDWYVHRPHIGLSQSFAANSLKSSYFYDGYQRLNKITDHEGNILATNFYKVSPSKNYIVSAKPRIATTDGITASLYFNSIVDYQHFDGLGRLTQSIGVGQTPDQKSIIKSQSLFDKFNRQIGSLLPVSAAALISFPVSNAKTLAQSFYGDAAPTDSTIFEASPLNRPSASFGVGEAWRAADKKNQIFYESGGIEVRNYSVNSSGDIVLNGSYPSNSLFKKRIIDEQGHQTIEYTDKRGRLVEKRQELESGIYAHTHYIYDGLGRPRAIIQPMGYELGSGFTYNSPDFQNWVFYYDYDSRGRNTLKHVPAAGFRKMVYDRKDRLVMQQDALQATLNKWNFWKYDAFDREAFRGETVNANSQAVLQAAFDTHATPDEVWSAGGGYNGGSFPTIANTSGTEAKHYTFYDNYDFTNILYTNSFFSVSAGTYDFVPHGPYSTAYLNQKGLETGSLSFDLSDNSKWYVGADYKDTKNRVIQNFQSHILTTKNAPDREDLEYNFAGDLVQARMLLRNVNEANKTILKQYTYDHVGRKTEFKLGINGATAETVAKYFYDAIGRQSTKWIYPNRTYYKADSLLDYINRPPNPAPNTVDLANRAVNLLPGTLIDTTYLACIDTLNISSGTVMGMQKMDYQYHIRGLQNCINCTANEPVLNAAENDFFASKLEWETAGRFDGNIGKQSWRNKKDYALKSYMHDFDAFSRLKSATYSGNGDEDYSIANINYDKNGNILNLLRKGFTGSSFGSIDDLAYSFSGNKLTKIDDAVSGNQNTKDFRDSIAAIDYTYWPNGNLKSDLNKGISQIDYNTYLNKPQKITFFNGSELNFNYDGSGNLLKRYITDSTTWNYTPSEIYKDDSLYQIAQDEGRILRNNGNFKLEFEYRDLWGNLRTAFTDSDSLPVSGLYPAPVISQINDYDLLGFEHFSNQQGRNNFLFQNQERLFDLELNVDFFKYRVSDPSIGRFWNSDPLSSKYPYNSNYAFQENKLAKGVELEGLELENFFSQFKSPSELKVKTPDPEKSQIQVYSTTIINSKKSFEEMKETFLKTPEKILSNSKAEFHAPENEKGEQTGLTKGNTIEIEIDKPGNDSYVKVHNVKSDKNSVSATFATLEGHVERGVINFYIKNNGNNGMTFTIGSMSQVDYGLLNLNKDLNNFAREEQRASWIEVLNNFKNITGGKETKTIIK